MERIRELLDQAAEAIREQLPEHFARKVALDHLEQAWAWARQARA